MYDQIERWRKELIDLGKRNPLLNYRPRKSSTLELLQPSLTDILERLGTARSTGWSFHIPVDTIDATQAPSASGLTIVRRGSVEGRSEPPSQKLRADEVLTDRSERSGIEGVLRNLNRRAVQEEVDRGISILYLALGMLSYRDDEAGGDLLAPLVLVPVTLVRLSPRNPFRLMRGEDDIVVNAALAAKLLNDYGLDISGIADRELTTDDVSPVIDELGEMFRARRDWKVTPRAVLSTFSFFKEIMYRDLGANIDAVAANRIVRSLALGQRQNDGEGDATPSAVSEDQVDDFAPPEGAINILDADASQRRCIDAAKRGLTFVMDGPPGTGKSQTIANIIAELIAGGKRVLFVSDKAAALDVVHKRLASRGLSEYLLEIHSSKATRRSVVEELGRALTSHPTPPHGMETADAERALIRRRELSSYAAAVNQSRAIGGSLFDVLGRLETLRSAPPAPIPTAVDSTLERSNLHAWLSVVDQLARAWGPVVRGDDFVWHGLSLDSSDPSLRRQIQRDIDDMAAALQAIDTEARRASEATTIEFDGSFKGARYLGGVLSLLENHPAIPPEWLTAGGYDRATALARGLETSTTVQRERERYLAEHAVRWSTLLPESATTFDVAEAAVKETPLRLTEHSTAAGLRGLHRWLATSSERLKRMNDDLITLASAFGCSAEAIDSVRAEQLATLGSFAEAPNRPEPGWLQPATAAALTTAAEELRELFPKLVALRERLSTTFTDRILTEDLEVLVRRFSEEYRGLKRLTSAYREDKYRVAMSTRRKKADHETIALLSDALEWQRTVSRIAHIEEEHQAKFGPYYYRGENTEFTVLVEALKVALDACQVVGSGHEDVLGAVLSRDAPSGQEVAAAGARLASNLDAWKRESGEHRTILRPDLDGMPLAQIGEIAERLKRDDATPLLPQLATLIDLAAEAGLAQATLAGTRRLLHECAVFDATNGEILGNLNADRQILGELYSGADTVWPEVHAALAWSKAFVSYLGGPVGRTSAATMLGAAPSVWQLSDVLDKGVRLREAVVARFALARQSDIRAELDGLVADALAYVHLLSANAGDIDEWRTYEESLKTLAVTPISGIVDEAVATRRAADQLHSIVERSVLERWVDSLLARDARLNVMRSADRNAYVDEYRMLDQKLVDTAAARVMHQCNERRPRSAVGQAAVIRKEAEKKSRHRPIRRLLEETADVAQALKPCFMMSPLTVSSFLTGALRFDVVIFDEASQVRPADAINCIYRGSQVIVAGDDKQLPPTSFFEALTGDSDEEFTEDQFEEYESVLGLFRSSEFEQLPLRWHYRSQHEGLITFSNRAFYNNNLVTFPSATSDPENLGVRLYRVTGTYRRGGERDNPEEATAVAQRVLYHARAAQARGEPLSLGVVTFSDAQRDAVESAVERLRGKAPELDYLFATDRLSGFFVKNLENVQGDERDTMVFSIGYGKDQFGRFHENLGPITRPGGERRLNVAITRARKRVEVVTTVGAEDFRGASESKGVRFLQQYLDYAERGSVALGIQESAQEGEADSPFESEVAGLINGWGFDTLLQVGSAGYRVDIGVYHPDKPGAFILGVECDGKMYHSSHVARDRDRLRGKVLTDLGWRLYRLWSTAWYHDRSHEEVRLRRAIDEALGQYGESRLSNTAQPLEGGPSSRFSIEPEGEVMDVIDLDAAPDWVVPYRVAELGRTRSPQYEMHDSFAGQEIHRLILATVKVEGPVSRECVLTRVREAWGVDRAGSRIRQHYDAICASLVRTQQLVAEGSRFLRIPGQADQVRCPTEDARSRRRVLDVPPTELDLAILETTREAHALTRDELSFSTAGWLGWYRRGQDVQAALDGSIDRLLERGVVIERGGLIHWPSI